jgi:copper transport protein
VAVPVPGIRNGTYTVTWRVVSADGHPVHGGFGFFVGAPSTISAVAVAGDKGGGRVVGWGFGVVRFTWFAALLALVGVVVVRRWVWTPATVAVGVSSTPAVSRFRRRACRTILAAWLVLAVAGVLSLTFQAASVSGLSLVRAARPSVWGDVLGTAYGHWWAVTMVCTAALGVPVAGLARRKGLWGRRPAVWIATGAVAVGGLCVAAALNGHARTLEHPAVGVSSVAIHLLAVGVWVGGLGALVVLGGPGWRSLAPDERLPVLTELVARFSRVAVVAAAVVVASGVLNAVLDLAEVTDLWRTGYGRVVLAKVVLVLVALALAARHRFVVPRRLAGATHAGASAGARTSDGGAAPSGGDAGLAAAGGFDSSSRVELVALVATVALAAGLVVLVPGRSLALAAGAAVNVERRVGPDTIQFFLDPSTVGDNQVHLTYVNAQGLTDSAVAQARASLRPVLAATATPPVAATVTPVALRLISPGHFVGDVTLPADGRYRLTVDQAGAVPGTTFEFRLKRAGGKGGRGR